MKKDFENQPGLIGVCRLKHWNEFIEITENLTDSHKFIWRGQSNSPWDIWELVPAFYRNQSYKKFYFFGWANKLFQSPYFNTLFYHYNFPEKDMFLKLDLLGRLYVAQHYGIPTCFMDFTWNPLIALYFGMSGVGGTDILKQSDGNLKDYPADWMMSIYCIDIGRLIDLLGIQTKLDVFEDFESMGSYLYLKKCLKERSLWGFDDNPAKRMGSWKHAEKQESCFLLFDHHIINNEPPSIEQTLRKYYPEAIPDPPIIIYRIPAMSILSDYRNEKMQLFEYLRRKDICGSSLFEDLTGIKYDLAFQVSF